MDHFTKPTAATTLLLLIYGYYYNQLCYFSLLQQLLGFWAAESL